MTQALALPLPGDITDVAWTPPADLTLDKWRKAGIVLAKIEQSMMWWVGDWWVYGLDHFKGEIKAIIESPDWKGPKYEVAHVAAYVAKRFNTVSRLTLLMWADEHGVPRLGWEHYHQAARLVKVDHIGNITGDKDAIAALQWALEAKASTRELARYCAKIKYPNPGPGKFTGDGPFDVVVCDPPWPLARMERACAPNQSAWDYPVMEPPAIVDFWLTQMEPRLAPDVHLFMWTTQKWLEPAWQVARDIGFNPILTMVWHKPGGFQPWGLPQYNGEFIVYARKGNPMFIDSKNFFCVFKAPRREMSRKPDEFYDTIRRVTDGNRIDVFSREPREGFAQYGDEIGKFGEPVEAVKEAEGEP